MNQLREIFKQGSIRRMLLVALLLMAVAIGGVALVNSQGSSQQVLGALSGNSWYISTTGNNTTGNSWATAWKNLSAVQWTGIAAGDTIYVDGGSTQMVYTGTLTPKSGVTVVLSQEQGRSGQAIFFGGRVTPLPDCDVATYNYQTVGVNVVGIDLGSSSDVTINGLKWRGIVIHGYNGPGVKLSAGALRNTVKYVEIYDNGVDTFAQSGKHRPDQPGVQLSGTGTVLDHAIIHDNGQDAFQSNGGISNFSLTNSWVYNARIYPGNPSLAYNFCMHSDGMQVYNGGTQAGVIFDSDVIGPGLMQGTLLGQTPSTIINNVTFNNVLILDGTNANIMGYDQIASQNWNINNVTSFHVLYDPDAGAHHNILLRGAGHSLRDSILYGGDCYIPDGISASGDFNWNTSGCTYGTHADPLFVAAPPYTSQATIADLIAGNYALQPGSPASGKGSFITSVAQLVGQPPPPTNTPGASPTPPPTVPPVPTDTITPFPTGVPTDTPVPTVAFTATPLPTDTPTDTPIPTATPMPTGVPTPIVKQVLCTETIYSTGRITIDCP